MSWLADHRQQVGLVLEDGRSGRVRHRAGIAQPVASAQKVLHLGAYATAVAAGRFDPAQPVRLADWQAYYLPGTDGGAHLRALDALGLLPANPLGVAALDDVVRAMIEFSARPRRHRPVRLPCGWESKAARFPACSPTS